jgi:hypothetical protein
MTGWSRLLLPADVTLSEAKGLSRWALRCFAPLSMTALGPYGFLDPFVTLHNRHLRMMLFTCNIGNYE